MKHHIVSAVTQGFSHGVGYLSQMHLPGGVLDWAVKGYAAGFGVNLSEAHIPKGGFSTFGEFFARELIPGVRPIVDEKNAVCFPCDGELLTVDAIDGDGGNRFMVKGYPYTVSRLTGMSDHDRYANGGGLVIYLHPRDYHRVHVPMDGTLTTVRHIAGNRYPVAPWSERRVSGLFERNERMVFNFATNSGQFCLIMVAACGVGHIATPFAPPVGEHAASERRFEDGVEMKKGDEIGAFRLGSTVVLLWSRDLLAPLDTVAPGPVRLGQKLGMTCK